ncbi:family 16 glycosylhydrolase [Paracoccus sp. JM45]|uniref:family 16 glycosylhydrolase n=1 Tax=Paracoccus sp. JM45 TaxID=2283626 RepID=UPI000E6C497A|nr:family 16 glycosylhydrolase [Paracoccus sp. JM45]RJE79001.1 hypothetical protein DWB67_14645 [Paracoccus sp. JM45]
MIQSERESGLNIYTSSEARPNNGWLVSDWGAGQTSIMNWSEDNVRVSEYGLIELILDRAPEGSSEIWEGGEIQNATATTTGTWSWTAQAPEMAPGAVFGMFTYKSDWKNAPWTEFDFEFVGDDTTRVQLNIHMIDASGQHVALEQNKENKTIIDLGFDAAKGMHTYEVSVSQTRATFYIDGNIVGNFTASDMPGNTWNLAPMNSYVDLWAAPSYMEQWTGQWIDPGRPLIAQILDAEIRDSEYGSTYVPVTDHVDETTIPDADILPGNTKEDGILGDEENNTLIGNSEDNAIYGFAGNDVLDGKSGMDAMYGMTGDDIYWVDDLGDSTVENTDEGYDQVNSFTDWTLADHMEALLLQNKLHINGTGNALDNTIIGSAGRNILRGLGGDDMLDGKGGQDIIFADSGSDTLVGGRGTDSMFGGSDNDRDTFVFNSVKDSRPGSGHDIVHDFISGVDKLDFGQLDANTSLYGQNDFVFTDSSTAYSIWTVSTDADLLIQADVDGDSLVDFEILIKEMALIVENDFIL